MSFFLFLFFFSPSLIGFYCPLNQIMLVMVRPKLDTSQKKILKKENQTQISSAESWTWGMAAFPLATF